MRINIIAAVDRNRAIGKENKLLYWLPNDLKRFKLLTTGHTIVMGRHTFESLPNGALPHRRNIVVSTTMKQRELAEGYSYHKLQGIEVFSSLTEALAACANEEDIYIIGGEKIYQQAIAFAHRLYLTIIEASAPHADAWFPPFNGWILKEESPRQGYSFRVYERVKK